MYNRYNWLDVKLVSATSASAHLPVAKIAEEVGWYRAVGGGARDAVAGADSTTWQAGGKDHDAVSPGTFTAYAIGIPGLGARSRVMALLDTHLQLG